MAPRLDTFDPDKDEQTAADHAQAASATLVAMANANKAGALTSDGEFAALAAIAQAHAMTSLALTLSDLSLAAMDGSGYISIRTEPVG